MPPRAATGSRDGIEFRTTAQGKRSYRWVINRSKAKGGKLRGDWTDSNAEAKSGRAKALGEVAAGTASRPSALTLRDAWEQFLAQVEAGTAVSRSKRTYKLATIRGYTHSWSKIDSELGAHRLTDIRRADVQAMIERWSATGTKPSTIRNDLDPLRVIYRRAKVSDLVTVDPTESLEVPGDAHDEPMRFASRQEAAQLIAALPPGERALWATAFYAGLRRGELRALHWEDVDLAGGLIHVSRSWDDKGGEQTPKTKGSNRKVAIVPSLLAILKAHKAATGRSGSDLVFGRTAADPFVASTARARALKAWKAADPPLFPITLHQCRHTFASLMIAAGCNAKALSVVMGHASITITFDRYGHLMPGGEQEVGKLLGEYLAAA
jgi:integrase